MACEPPEDYERPITHWTYAELADELAKQGVVESISPAYLGRLLKKNDLRPHKSKYWLNAKADERKDERINDIFNVYQKAATADNYELTISVDEMTGIQALERIALDIPMTKGQPIRREKESYKRNK